jgi:hypothetical protein
MALAPAVLHQPVDQGNGRASRAEGIFPWAAFDNVRLGLRTMRDAVRNLSGRPRSPYVGFDAIAGHSGKEKLIDPR